MKKVLLSAAIATMLFASCSKNDVPPMGTPNKNDIVFNDLATLWDEGMPLGNAIIGANVWQKGENLRMAIDRIDLWDLRPTDSLSGDNFRYKWVEEQWCKGTYENVQNKMDVPYDVLAAPSKIPGAAIEFNVSNLGTVTMNRVYIDNALLEIKWDGGAKFTTFVHALKPIGWFVFEGVSEEMIPTLLTPRYEAEAAAGSIDPVNGQDLRRLDYKQGKITDTDGVITYRQEGWNGAYYDAAIKYEYNNGILKGVWSLTSSISDEKAGINKSNESSALKNVLTAYENSINDDYSSHSAWWSNFWSRSSISLPNATLEKQYYNEIYKFGCSTREDSYIIPLQSVWTADNGLLPPWKGDVHHDLNTQLSYWPTYTANLCDVGMSYINTLWNQREVNRKYTKEYFGVDGINVPGVATLTGEPMGGWIQYSLSPTISAWLSQHFYLHWRYTMDEKFLSEKGYPYVKDVAQFLENITFINNKNERVLPISSSPEIFNNSPEAWFPTMTNYDLGLIYYAFEIASEMAYADNKPQEAEHWNTLKQQLPKFELDTNSGLMFAKGHPYNESHRHFSNAIAVMPMSIFDVTKSENDRKIVEGTIELLDKNGPDYWCGYSYSWLANMKARALDGDGAFEALETFANCFVLRNGFHVNGDQSNSGKSKFTYRPFTLEGNFAFAAGVQEMLLQSHTDVVRIFPAIPETWKDVAFNSLRARGALVVSASKKDGKVNTVTIICEKGGKFKIENPFDGELKVEGAESVDKLNNNIYSIDTKANSTLRLLPM